MGRSTFSSLPLHVLRSTSLEPGSASGEREARAERWPGEGERVAEAPPPFPLPRLPLGSLRSPIAFFAQANFSLLLPQWGLVFARKAARSSQFA